MNFIHLSVHKTFFVSIMIDHVVTRISAILVILCRKIIKIISLNLSLTEMSTPRPYDYSGLHVYHSIIKHNSSDCVCPGLPYPYLWTDFETKGTYGLPMTQGWLQKYKILKFRKIKKIPSLNASSYPKDKRGPPEAALKRVILKETVHLTYSSVTTLLLEQLE